MTAERLAGFEAHRCTIQGAWTEDRGVREWRGTLHLPVPSRVLVLVTCGAARHFAKSGRLAAGPVLFALRLQGPNPDGSTQIMVRAGSACASDARPESAIAAVLRAPDMLALETGALTDWATTPDGALVVALLPLAAADIETKRNGIWGVKPCHRDGLPPDWAEALTRGRHGMLPAG